MHWIFQWEKHTQNAISSDTQSESTLLCVKFGERGKISTLLVFKISLFPHFHLHEPPCTMMGQSSFLFGFHWVEQWKIINTSSVLERTVIGHPEFWFPDTHPELGCSPTQVGSPYCPSPETMASFKHHLCLHCHPDQRSNVTGYMIPHV